MQTDFSTWTTSKLTHIEQVLSQTIPDQHTLPHKLHEAMRYSVLGGGKRVRALLCYASAELCNTEDAVADAGASAVELIHAYSLVHDDMPCMDDDDLRRGKPSCHKQYDDATALLVGDALQSLAFDVLSKPGLCKDPMQQIGMLSTLAKASGSYGMAGGQAIDLDSIGKPLTQQALEIMHARKTGALIEAATLLGASAGSREQITAIQTYARKIGLAFQVIDDILDVEADTQTLGKTAGKDAGSNKPTYVSILGLARAKELAHDLYEVAIAAIYPYGEGSLRLRELATYITQRAF
ncbi:MAG: polyprenyl synthetase family protein [Betaproteobacteria bacterium]|nr:polyprenyl synthetase family protein [Betaproteobacteria bacterium]